MLTKTGTLAFCAPEIFTTGYYDEKVDVWSAGAVLYMMLCGQMPFDDESIPTLIGKITTCDYVMRGAVWAKVSQEAKALVRAMLEMDPKERVSAREALE